MELDTTKLRQAGFRKTVTHDNCNVLDIGSGSFPRYIEVRPPGDDGSRMTAIWDGILDIAVNNTVKCIEYGANPIWAIDSMGGNESAVGKIRVNKVFASDFSSESLVTDASDNVTINTGTLTLPSDIIHGGDADTKWSFTDDKISIDAGGLNMLALTETTQDLVEIGDVAGGGDVDINFNSGQMFLQGNNNNIGINTTTTTFTEQALTITSQTILNKADTALHRGATFKAITNTAGRNAQNAFIKAKEGPAALASGDRVGDFLWSGHDGTDYNRSARFGAVVDGSVSADTVPMGIVFDTSETNSGGITERVRISPSGLVGIGATLPLAQTHIDQASTIAAIPVLLLDQGDISEQCITFSSDGADRDIRIYDINVTGTPTMLWDESENRLNWNKGFLIQGRFLTQSGQIKKTTRITSSPYTVLAQDNVIIVDTDGGAITVNLPAGVDGTHYRITNVGTAANDVTVDPNGTEQLFGGGAGVSFALIDGETINIYFETTENWW